MTSSESGPVAVVTGSSSGIGRAIALRLAADGFNLVVHAATNKPGAAEVCGAIEKVGRQASIVLCDFASGTDLDDFAAQCWQWRGAVDVWVNNAGVDVLTGKAATLDFPEKLSLVLDVDVRATLLLSRNIGNRMCRRYETSGGKTRGTIINIGWDQAHQGMAGQSGELFAASKGAIMAATRSLAQSLAPAVRVNCLAPGWIRTQWGEQASEAWQQRARRESLLERWGSPEDVAGVASFLASDAASFVNGQTIPVNGGFRFGTHEANQ